MSQDRAGTNTTLLPTSDLEQESTDTRPGLRKIVWARLRKRSFLRAAGLHATLMTLAAVLLLPFAWFVSVALRPREELFQLWPSSITFDNFRDMFRRVPQMVSFFWDSIVITGSTVVLVVVVASLAGYAFARIDFPLSQPLFWLVIFTMFVPPVMAIGSLYTQLFNLGLLDTRIGLILVYVSWNLGLGTFIMRAVFAAIPMELEEAARVDGASHLRILWKIMAPLGAGGAVVVALLTFVLVWGEYVLAFTFVGNNVRPMSIGIKLFQPHASDPEYSFNVAAAAGLVMFIPSIVIYIAMQRWFTKGLLEGGIKG